MMVCQVLKIIDPNLNLDELMYENLADLDDNNPAPPSNVS